jgi:hypothetical protein
MASLDDKIRRVVAGYQHDHTESHGLSPCILKQILQELIVYVFTQHEHAVIRSLLYDVLTPDVTVLQSDPRYLSAPDYVRWLCTQYTAGPYCSETVVEQLWKERKLALLRGGVRPVYLKIRRYLVSV